MHVYLEVLNKHRVTYPLGIYTSISARVYIYTHTYTYIYIYIYINVNVYRDTFTYVFIYVYIYYMVVCTYWRQKTERGGRQ